MYKLTIAPYAEITAFNASTQDWSGAQFTKVVDYPPHTLKELTLAEIARTLSEVFCADITENDIMIDEAANAITVTEDADGFQDPSGKFLVDYFFTVEKTESMSLMDLLA